MAIHQVRLPDKAGTPRVVTAEAPAPPTLTTPPAPTGDLLPHTRPPEEPDRPAPPAPEADRRPWYRAEAWLAVELAAFAPMLAAFAAPEAFRIPLVALSALLAAIGLAMLAVRETGPRAEGEGAGARR